jgi:hypothetical protein
MTPLLYSLGRSCVRHRRLVLALWLVVFAVLAVAAQRIIDEADPARSAGLAVSFGGYLGQKVSKPETTRARSSAWRWPCSCCC